MRMNFKGTHDFNKDFKRLSKKYKSLRKDLELFKKIVTKFPLGKGRHFTIVTKTESMKIVKARFFCLYLKRDSLRIIYAFSEKKEEIEFIELYFKGDKNREDKDRIENYFN